MDELVSTETREALGPVAMAIVALEMELEDRERQIDMLRRDVERMERMLEDARGRAAMAQAAWERHLARCGSDDGAIQRLMSALAESNSRRKEQATIIERRDRRILALVAELERYRQTSEGSGRSFQRLVKKVRRAFSRLVS